MEAETSGPAVPVVDVSAFRESAHPATDAAAIAAARAMGAAFERCGFVVVTGHGLAVELGDALYARSAAFHDLPDDVKLACQGFIPHGDENVSQLIGNMSKPNDVSDRLSISNERNVKATSRTNAARIVTGNPREAALQAERSAELHADDLVPGIQEAGQRYFDEVHRVWQLLTRMCEVELELPLHYFDEFYPAEWGAGSLRCYPTLPSEAHLEPEQMRFGAHTDSGGLTLLRTDMEGLQCNIDGVWHDVPVVRGALVVNVARLLARW
jgi:isopenicillin N synthase-like dioxygenase